MNPETFFDKFGLLADTPNGVQKLRELILQLAVQGKLVPQDPNDEPAAMLLEKIKAEKERLVKEKKIKKIKQLPDFEDGELPYELPNEWLWTWLGQIANSVHYGYTASANHELKDVRLLRITDIQNGRVNWNSVPGCEIDEKIVENYRLYKGDLLIARTGGTIGKSYLVEKPTLCAVFASYLIRVVPNNQLFPNYLKIFLESPLYWKQLYEKSMGTGQPNVNGTSLRALILPLPPLQEQRRIVAKVDQLMALCDELEAQQQKKQEARLYLNSAALDRLLTAHEPDEFAHHWQRICDNFDLLYDNPDNVGELRKAILQLAVQGKLVPQDPNDEPASKSLKLISNERENAIDAKIIKKSQPLPSLVDEELPFNPPSGWVFERFGKLFRFIDYRGKTPKKVESGIRLITAKNIRIGYRQDKPTEFITEKNYHEWMTRGFPEKGDLLFSTEAPMGNVCIVDLDEKFALAQRTINLHPWGKQNSQYFMFAIMSPLIQGMISEKATGMTATGIKAAKLKLVPLPLPPLAEQCRIVTKVDQLMAFCDELEAKIKQSRTDGEILMEAVVHQLVEA